MQKYSRIGGILAIIAGSFSIFYLLMGTVYMLLPQLMDSAVASRSRVDSQVVTIFMTVFGAVMCLFAIVTGALSITGGIFGLKRKHWAVALAGAISAALLFFPLGIIATVFISLGRTEFDKLQASDPPTEIVCDMPPGPAEVG